MARPDYHFLYIDKTLDAEWLFIASRRYWERFRPMVIDDLDLVGYLPPQRTVAITTLARRDMAKMIADLIKKTYPTARYDPLVYDYVEEMKLTLDGRADLQQRFGLPEDLPETLKKKRKSG
ncbi:MAG: hypothetical protein ABI947_10390 [Chloroflexota bacterium]